MIDVKIKYDVDEMEKLCARDAEKQFPAPKGFHWDATFSHSYGNVSCELEENEDEEVEQVSVDLQQAELNVANSK